MINKYKKVAFVLIETLWIAPLPSQCKRRCQTAQIVQFISPSPSLPFLPFRLDFFNIWY